MFPGTIVTDCSLIGGDSGGPLFDLSGRLVGIHSRIGADVTENMHVPVDEFTRNFERLVKGEKWGVLPGYEPMIGIQGDEKDGQAIISKVNPGGPAERAGLKVGDIVLSFDGESIKSFNQLKEAVHGCLPGDQISIEIAREGRVLSRTMVVGLRNP
jgi:S1-C subfamily serine protease